MPLVLPWLQLGGAAVIILVASNFLTRASDTVALKTGLGRSFIGVVMLATATSLPELGAGVSSIVVVGQPNLAAGDAFGSNVFNLLIIALLDIFWRRGPILTRVSTTSIITGSLGIIIIALAASAMMVHRLTTAFDGWYVSPITLIMLAVYIMGTYLIYRYEQSQEIDGPGNGEDGQTTEARLPSALLMYAASAAAVVAAAIWLSNAGESIAHAMGWEASFVGNQFLAASTSLPELATSFAAIRINAPELAVSNILGSNFFNMGFILFLDDVVYTGGSFWSAISPIHTLTAVMAMLITSVVIISLASRSRSRPGTFWTFESITIIGMYVVTSLLVFGLS